MLSSADRNVDVHGGATTVPLRYSDEGAAHECTRLLGPVEEGGEIDGGTRTCPLSSEQRYLKIRVHTTRC